MGEEKSLDVLGIKVYGEALNRVLEGVGAFLGRICLPAAEEFGLMLQDRVKKWRTGNLVEVVQVAERRLLEEGAPEGVHADPRLVARILDESSWTDDSQLQEMWGGLLASSCSESGNDDSNLLFMNLLSGLTKLQAHLLKYSCETTQKGVSATGLILGQSVMATAEDLVKITGEQDIDRLDREMDQLRALGLLNERGGFDSGGKWLIAQIGPSCLALHMYVRCQGSRRSPVVYFGVEKPAGQADPSAQQTATTSDEGQPAAN